VKGCHPLCSYPPVAIATVATRVRMNYITKEMVIVNTKYKPINKKVNIIDYNFGNVVVNGKDQVATHHIDAEFTLT